MKIKTILILLNILAFLASVIWLYIDKTLEPLISTLTLAGTLLVLFFNTDDNNTKTTMKQKGGKNSTNYQAGGNINL